MKKRAAWLVASAVVVGVAGSAGAETIIDTTSQIAIEIPTGWSSQTKGEVITLSDAKGDVAMTFVAVDAGAVKAASKAAHKALEEKFKKLAFKPEQKVTINGMSGVAMDGTGAIGGTDVDLSVIFLDTPADKDLFIVAIAESAKLAKHRDEIKFVFDHLHAKK